MRRATLVAGLVSVATLATPPSAWSQEYAFEFGDPSKPDPERLEIAANSVAVDADGNPWVSDPGKNRIVKFGYDGTFIAEFTTVSGVPLTSPTGIAADDQGTVYVAVSNDSRIVTLDTGGRPTGTIQLLDDAGQPVHPSKLAVDSASGRFFVADGSNVVRVFERDGSRVGDLSLGSGWTVRDVATGSGQVVATYNTEDPDADGLRIWTTELRDVRDFRLKAGLAAEEVTFDPAGRVLFADPRAGLIRRIDFATSVHDGLGTRGLDPGQMNGPVGVATDCRGNVYALDGAARYDTDPLDVPGSKVLKFTVPADPPPCAPRPLPEGFIGTQINDVEVTQAVQPPLSYTAAPPLPTPDPQPRTRAYGQTSGGGPSGELGLKTRLPTVVRVYANLSGGPTGGLSNIPATLEGIAQGGRSLGVVQPVGRPAILRVGERIVDPPLRARPASAYSFELPNDWTTQGPLTLVARVNPAGTGCDPDCVARSTFRLTGVAFGPTKLVRVAPIALTDGGRRPAADPARFFLGAQRVTPMQLEVWGWQADVEVGDLLNTEEIVVEECFLGVFPCDEETYGPSSPEFRDYLQGELLDRLEDVAEDRDIRGCNRVAFGVAPRNPNLPGAMRGELEAAGLLPCALGYAAEGAVSAEGDTVDRPLTAVAHELHHAFGRPHAGRRCPGTGEDDDQEGEPWPPDDRGLLGGIGLDTRRLSLSARGPFNVIAPGVAPNPLEVFDLMSYCASESEAWISPRNWAALSNWRVNSRRAATVAVLRQAPGRRLRVSALQFASGKLAVTGVSPTRLPADPVDPASPYVVESMDEAGTVLASAPASGVRPADGGGVEITGTVAAPAGTAQVFVRRGTEAGTRRVATPHAPKVRIRSPRAGRRVASRTLDVRYRATDADGGELSSTVEYSGDGGRSWTRVQAGPASGRVAVPRTLLAGSRRARVRVRVDDGFNEAVATSKRFTVVAPKPVVSISSPQASLTIGADSPLTLTGKATGAYGRLLPASRLQWLDGRRKLGRGASITVRSLSPGRHKLTLRAAQGDSTGRALRTVTVKRTKPAFLVREVPANLAASAKRLRLRVASTVAATLRVRGKKVKVSPKARTITVRIKPGRAALKLRLALQAGKLRTTETVTIARS